MARFYAQCNCLECTISGENRWREVDRCAYKNFMLQQNYKGLEHFRLVKIDLPRAKYKAVATIKGPWVCIMDGKRRLAAFYMGNSDSWYKRMQAWMETHPEVEIDLRNLSLDKNWPFFWK